MMNAEIRDFVSQCSVCNTLRPEQCREELKPHELPTRPWSKVGTDLFTFDGKNYIVTVDYYSNFIEMDKLSDTTSKTAIETLKKQFARHGIPDILVSDNGPQYSSDEFRQFAKHWEFRHITSSPRHPQSNGKAESAVKICKTILKKAQLAQNDVYLALLDHRNTPTEQTYSSPAQRLFGRRTRTLLPVSPKLLKPEIQTNVMTKLATARAQQASHYNKVSQTLPEIQPGEVVRLKLPGNSTWSQAICKGEVAPRSYEVECNGRTYRRNRKDLRPTSEPLFPVTGIPTSVDLPAAQFDEQTSTEFKIQESNTSPNSNPVSDTATNSLQMRVSYVDV